MCVAIDKCKNVTCGWGWHCNNGICVENHTSTCNCSSHEQCINDMCVAVDPCHNIYCPYDETCVDGFCIDKCSLILCPQGSMC